MASQVQFRFNSGSSQVGSGRVRSGQVESGRVRSGQVRSSRGIGMVCERGLATPSLGVATPRDPVPAAVPVPCMHHTCGAHCLSTVSPLSLHFLSTLSPLSLHCLSTLSTVSPLSPLSLHSVHSVHSLSTLSTLSLLGDEGIDGPSGQLGATRTVAPSCGWNLQLVRGGALLSGGS